MKADASTVETAAVETETPAPPGVEAASDGKKKKKKKSDKAKKGAPVEVAQAAREPAPVEAKPAPTAEPPIESKAEVSAPAGEVRPTPLAFAPADDDHDLSISNHHFFSSADIEPPPPLVEEEPKFLPPSKEVLARRARLKQIVGGVVAVSALVAAIGVGKMVLGSKPADALPSSTPAAKSAPAKTEETKATEPTATATQAAPAKVETPAPSADVSATPADSASAAPSASADAPPGEKKSPEEIKKLEIQCMQLGNGTDMKKAVETCREALAAGGTNAMTYMYIYNSLVTLGKGKEAREALDDCVTNATTGNKGECAQWGGKKKN